MRRAPPSCSPHTTWRRPNSCAARSPSSTRARYWSTSRWRHSWRATARRSSRTSILHLSTAPRPKNYDPAKNLDTVLHHDAQRVCAHYAHMVADAPAVGGHLVALLYYFWGVHRLAVGAHTRLLVHAVYRARAHYDVGHHKLLQQHGVHFFLCKIYPQPRRDAGLAHAQLGYRAGVCERGSAARAFGGRAGVGGVALLYPPGGLQRTGAPLRHHAYFGALFARGAHQRRVCQRL